MAAKVSVKRKTSNRIAQKKFRENSQKRYQDMVEKCSYLEKKNQELQETSAQLKNKLSALLNQSTGGAKEASAGNSVSLNEIKNKEVPSSSTSILSGTTEQIMPGGTEQIMLESTEQIMPGGTEKSSADETEEYFCDAKMCGNGSDVFMRMAENKDMISPSLCDPAVCNEIKSLCNPALCEQITKMCDPALCNEMNKMCDPALCNEIKSLCNPELCNEIEKSYSSFLCDDLKRLCNPALCNEIKSLCNPALCEKIEKNYSSFSCQDLKNICSSTTNDACTFQNSLCGGIGEQFFAAAPAACEQKLTFSECMNIVLSNDMDNLFSDFGGSFE